MERSPDQPHSKYPHVYPIVRIDTPFGHSDPTQNIIVVKVLTSQSDAETEVSRLGQVNADKSCLYFWCTSTLVEHRAGGSAESRWVIRYAEQKDKKEVSLIRATLLPGDHLYHYEENIGLNRIAPNDKPACRGAVQSYWLRIGIAEQMQQARPVSLGEIGPIRSIRRCPARTTTPRCRYRTSRIRNRKSRCSMSGRTLLVPRTRCR